MEETIPGFWVFVALVGALIGALLPVDDSDDKKFLGFIPIRIFRAVFIALLFCFLALVSSGDPNPY